ncbi:hypothetical protein [Wolbachia pipientis]|uniref:hypothetical protein n=1 Tax=Wolbachia pipientis TaxID=955 RepID=UPI0025A4AE84|nr:hypothetical protein [Wolbachia pipientis]MDM8334896.1 hypothetical protein [Wolbachia pipientis]
MTEKTKELQNVKSQLGKKGQVLDDANKKILQLEKQLNSANQNVPQLKQELNSVQQSLDAKARELESKNKELEDNKNRKPSAVDTQRVKGKVNYASASFILSGMCAVGASLTILYLVICILHLS